MYPVDECETFTKMVYVSSMHVCSMHVSQVCTDANLKYARMLASSMHGYILQSTTYLDVFSMNRLKRVTTRRASMMTEILGRPVLYLMTLCYGSCPDLLYSVRESAAD